MNNFPVKIESWGSKIIVEECFELAGIIVEAGFESDGITTPRMFWWKWHPMSDPLPAALVHDWCIKYHDYAFARDKLKEALAHPQLELPKWEQRTIYSAVRLKDWQRRNTRRLVNWFNRHVVHRLAVKFKLKNGR